MDLRNRWAPLGTLVLAALLTGCGGGGNSGSGSSTGAGVIALLNTAPQVSTQAIVTTNFVQNVVTSYQFINQSGADISATDPMVMAVVAAARNQQSNTLALIDCESPGSRNTPQYVVDIKQVTTASNETRVLG